MAQPTSTRMVTSTWTVPAYLPMQCLESRAQKCEPKGPALHGKRQWQFQVRPPQQDFHLHLSQWFPAGEDLPLRWKWWRPAWLNVDKQSPFFNQWPRCSWTSRKPQQMWSMSMLPFVHVRERITSWCLLMVSKSKIPRQHKVCLVLPTPCTLQTFCIILVLCRFDVLEEPTLEAVCCKQSRPKKWKQQKAGTRHWFRWKGCWIKKEDEDGGEIEFDLGRICSNQGLVRRSDFPDEAYKNSTRAEACYKGHLQVSNMPHGPNSAASDHHKMLQSHPWVFTLCEPMVQWWGSPDRNLPVLPGGKGVQWNDDLVWTWWFPCRYSKSNGARKQFRLKLLFFVQECSTNYFLLYIMCMMFSVLCLISKKPIVNRTFTTALANVN